MLEETNHNFFCSNCQFNIEDEKLYKIHYKSDFHRYNIKRKLLALQPATYEQYLKLTVEKVEKYDESDYKCNICNKTFGTRNTFAHHLKSKKHAEREEYKKSMPEIVPQEKKEFVAKETTLDNLNICLFCNNLENSIPQNIDHMRRAHSFFILDDNFLVNVEGLLKYLAEKINKGLLCIYCDNKGTKGFKSADAIRNHMIDKSHCFMNSDYFDEFEEFYDFSSQFEELQKENLLASEGGHIGDIEVEEDEETKQWQDDEEGTNENGEKEIMEKKTKKSSFYRVRKVKLLDTGEIQLPNGKILGHRAYRFIYKQKIFTLHNTIGRYKALIGQAFDGRHVALLNQNAQMMLYDKYMKQQEERVNNKLSKKTNWLANYHYLHLGLGGNYLQHHFRKQVP